MPNEITPSEVKPEGVVTPVVTPAELQQTPPPVTDNSPVTSTSKPTTKLEKVEEVLKTLKPEEVLKYQRELSVEMGKNLFQGKYGELFNKYKPNRAEQQSKVKEMAALLKPKPKSPPKTQPTSPEQDTNLKTELLRTKVELELVKNGVPQDFMEEATTVAMTKVKDMSNLNEVKTVAQKFSQFNKPQHAPAPVPQRTSIPINDKDKHLTDGEKAISFLRKLNPKGFK